MANDHIAVPVAKGLEDLIPAYMKNRAKEVETLRDALSKDDLEQLRRLGHRMKGVGEPYGFGKVSALGKQIEDGAKAGDRATLSERIAEYADYISRVRVVYK